jgi:hypothetical protein
MRRTPLLRVPADPVYRTATIMCPNGKARNNSMTGNDFSVNNCTVFIGIL